MSVNGDKVIEDGRILTDRGQRIRDVRIGFDGYLYVFIDEFSGELFKVSLRNQLTGIIIILRIAGRLVSC